MEFVDPRSTTAAPIEPYRGHSALGSGETIGLFANGFPDSVVFLEHVGVALTTAFPGIRTKLWNKVDASALASQEHLEEITAECSAVVVAYGHCGSCTSGTVRDGIELARRDRAVVALVTEQFWQQGDLIAVSNGMPDVPRLRLPHPVAGTGSQAMTQLAAELAPRIIAVLRGEQPADNESVQQTAA